MEEEGSSGFGGSSGFEGGGVPETPTSDQQAEAPVDLGGPADEDNVNHSNEGGSSMNLGKIALILGLVLAVILGIPGVGIPFGALILAILGLVVGFTDDSDQVTVLVTALALAAVHTALNDVPAAGAIITGILGGVSSLINAAALAVIVKGIVARVT